MKYEFPKMIELIPEQEQDNVRIIHKTVSRCEPSDHQSFWVHNDDRYRFHFEPQSTIGLFVCSCRKCEHQRPDWETLPEQFAASFCFQDYLKHREYEDKERAAREERRTQRALDEHMESLGQAALGKVRRIAEEGYTEEIAYEIKELIISL